ncbi:MAG: ATP-binding protein [Polyangiaceae bacterium]
MSARFMKHNPAFLSREELVRGFVARKEDLAFVLDHIADNTGASSQHLLIVAPRGMGKTTLVLRAAEAVRTEARFAGEWYPLVYAEETYEATTAAELWLEGVRHLGEQTKDPEIQAAYRDLRGERDEQRLYDRALGRLIEFAEEQKKRIVLVVENLHMLLGEQLSDADAWKLRKTLQTERRLLLLATATASFDAIESAERAFFDQFRVYRLEPLDLESARSVWESVAGTPVSAAHMRPLQILTGGNPRLLAILASFAGAMSLRTLMGDLVHLVDDHTTYFKSNLESLPTKERKVYVALADLWQPSTAREVAEQARLSTSEASALLGRLTQRGAVTASGDERKKVYQLAERMYNIYHLLRRSGGDETRVKAVVDFMVGFYDPVSLGGVIKAIAEEGAGLGEEERRDHLLVMEALFKRESNPRVRELWLNQASPHATQLESDALHKEAERIRNAWVIERASFMGVTLEPVFEIEADPMEVLRQLEGIAEPEARRAMADLLGGDMQMAAFVGVGLVWAHRYALAISALEQGLKESYSAGVRAALLGHLGFALRLCGSEGQAEVALREAVTLCPKEPAHLASLARILGPTAGSARESAELARRAIAADARQELAWVALAIAFDQMMRGGESQDYQASAEGTRTTAAGLGIQGMWELARGVAREDRQAVMTAAISLQNAWKRGLRSTAVAPYLLLGAVDATPPPGLEEKTIRSVVDHIATSFYEPVIERSFGILWRSENPRVHALCASHPALLLADSMLSDGAALPALGLLIVLHRWEEAVPHLRKRIPVESADREAISPEEDTLSSWRQIFIDAAATGHARDALDLLLPSPLAQWLEPVVIALHSHIGVPVRAPLEVSQVASDVLDAVRKRADALKAQPQETKAQPASGGKARRQQAPRATRAREPRAKTRAPKAPATRKPTPP